MVAQVLQKGVIKGFPRVWAFCAAAVLAAMWVNQKNTLVAESATETESSRSLVGWWRLDEGEGVVARDESGRGYDAEWVGEEAPRWVKTNDGCVLEFHAEDGGLVTPVMEELVELEQGVTVAAWVRLAEGGQNGTILDTWVQDELSGSFALWLSEGRPVFEVVMGGRSVMAVGRDALRVGAWHHVAGRFDGQRVEVVVDGQIVGAVTAVGVLDGCEQAMLIGRAANGWGFAGQISDVRVYREALKDEELMNAVTAEKSKRGWRRGDAVPVSRGGAAAWDGAARPAGGESNQWFASSGISLASQGAAMHMMSVSGCVVTQTLASGVTATECSLDGSNYSAASGLGGIPGNYHTIPGTAWIGCAGAPENGSAFYRARFVLDTVSGVTFNIKVHADNVAKVFLNGNLILAQPHQEIEANFQDPAEHVTVTDPSLFVIGTNTVVIEVYNFHNPSGLNYLATITSRVELSVRWEAVVNPLDENPNAGGGLRIFADRANPNEPPSISNQMARVRVEVDPMFDGLPLYFRILDVDDPSTDEGPVDANGPDGNDNRPDGTAVPAGGRMVQSVVIVSNGVAVADVELSRQPGNNFRVAVACEAGELERLTVGGGGAGLIPVPANNEAELPGFAGRLTPMLTVWRRLHVELDSMAAVIGNNKVGNITEIRGSFPLAREVSVAVDLRDGSPDLDNIDVPGGLGRFENGRFLINGPFGAVETLGICCNGANYIQRLEGISLPFRITKPGLAAVSGQVWRWDANSREFYLAITAGNLTGSYKGGMFEVGGVAMEIRKVKPGQSIVEVKQLEALSCIIHDDDDDTLLPRVPDASLLTNALAEAYVVPRFDTVPAHGTNSVPHINLETPGAAAAAQNWLSKAANKEDFWIVYVLNAFQGPRVRDGDPNSEFGQGTQFARTVSPVGGSLINVETCRDFLLHVNALPDVLADFQSREIDFSIFEASVVLHEIGHAVSGSGLEVTNVQGHLVGDGVTTGRGRYLAEYLNLIRSAKRPMP